MSKRVLTDRAGGRSFVIFWNEGVASAVNASAVGKGRDIGETAVFRVDQDRAGGFTALGNGRFADKATGSVWDMTGTAVSGPRKGNRLERLPHYDTFWFAWNAFDED